MKLGIVYGHGFNSNTLVFVTKPNGPQRVLKYGYILESTLLIPKWYVEFEENRTEWTVDEFI